MNVLTNKIYIRWNMFETNIIYIIQDMNFLFNKLPYSLIDIDSLSFGKSSRIDL